MGRGRLRLYLGAAPGVGKTFAMLGEGNRRAERGADVVIGWVETHGRARTAEQIGALPRIAPRRLVHRGVEVPEMDVAAIIERRPDMVLVDELAHTNVAGSRNDKRWQDVHQILDAGIDVVSTLNVQHLESVNDVVAEITGVRQHETVPDQVARAADQIELVDMSADALRRRLAHGNVYPAGRIDAALANYFRQGNLEALRELALLWVADRVDEALATYRRQHGIERRWETRERVLVALTGAPSGEQLVRRGARIAQRGHGDLLGVHVRATDGRSDAPTALLEVHRELLEGLGGTYHELIADDPVAALTDFARRENCTQLVLGASRRSRWTELTRGSLINAVIRKSGGVDVHVISVTDDDAGDADDGTRPGRSSDPRPANGLGPRRRAAGWVVAIVVPILLTVVLTNLRDLFDQGSQFILYLLAVLAAAAVGGAAPALLAAVFGAVLLNWYFTEPLYTLTVSGADNAVALVVFCGVGGAFGWFVTSFRRRTTAVARANLEAEALARVAAGLVGEDDPIPSMLERIRSTVALDGVALLAAGTDEPLAVAGDVDRARQGSIAVGNGTLALYGDLHAEDRRLLDVFASQLASALERRQLRQQAAAAATLAETDALRTAVLRAVSHDLRTPLASIKAAVTSLLAGDVSWSDAERDEFLAAIDHEADRLDHIVSDLLDAGRLEVGAIAPALQPTALDEVVTVALAELGEATADVIVDVDPMLAPASADPGLLGRAVANVLANAIAHSPPDQPPSIVARSAAGALELHIVDHGPGISEEDAPQLFQPFQRLGDHAHRPGVGLGLHVAKGFVEAQRGTIELEATPGGGLTVVIRLPIAREHGPS